MRFITMLVVLLSTFPFSSSAQQHGRRTALQTELAQLQASAQYAVDSLESLYSHRVQAMQSESKLEELEIKQAVERELTALEQEAQREIEVLERKAENPINKLLAGKKLEREATKLEREYESKYRILQVGFEQKIYALERKYLVRASQIEHQFEIAYSSIKKGFEQEQLLLEQRMRE